MVLRFRNQISPLRRGFLLFGAGFGGAGRSVGGVPPVPAGADGVELSVAGSGGLSAQTRWSLQGSACPRLSAAELAAAPDGHEAGERCCADGAAPGRGGGAAAMRGWRIVHDRCGHRAKHGAQIWTCARAFGYREICPSRQFPSGMWRLRPISPPVASGGHDRFIGCLDAYEDVRGVRRVGLTRQQVVTSPAATPLLWCGPGGRRDPRRWHRRCRPLAGGRIRLRACRVRRRRRDVRAPYSAES
jgi:hypothetical protein